MAHGCVAACVWNAGVRLHASPSLFQRTYPRTIGRLAEATHTTLNHFEFRCTVLCLTRPNSSMAMRRHRKWMGLSTKEKRSEELVDDEEDFPENGVFTYRIMEHAASGEWDAAVQVFNDVVNKNTVVYNAMINASDKCRQYNHGLALFQEMVERSVKPSLVTYSSVLTLHGRLGQYKEALKLWQTVPSTAVRESASCITALLNAAARGGHPKAAEAHLQEALEAGRRPQRAWFGCVIKAHRDVGDATSALRILRRMREYSTPPSVVEYTQAMGAVATASRQGETAATRDRVNAIVSNMPLDGVRADRYFVEAHVKALLHGPDLGHILRRPDIVPLPPRDIIDEVLSLLRNAEQAGMTLSKLLLGVELWLSESTHE